MNTLPCYWGDGKLRDATGKVSGKYDAKLSPQDIIEMQIIDADCNDCRHFKRGAMVKVPGLKFFEGHCIKLDKPTRAYPMQYTGHECFEHRKTP